MQAQVPLQAHTGAQEILQLLTSVFWHRQMPFCSSLTPCRGGSTGMNPPPPRPPPELVLVEAVASGGAAAVLLAGGGGGAVLVLAELPL